MNETISEFAPLDLELALELEQILNDASARGEAVIVQPDGISGSADAGLLSPTEDTNGLVRYQRHYCRGAVPCL